MNIRDRAVFAAERRPMLEGADGEFAPVVSTSLVRLRRTPNAEWYSGIITRMRQVWDVVYESEAGAAPTEQALEGRAEFEDRLVRTLDLTTTPEPSIAGRRAQVDRISKWLSTATVNDATYNAAVWASDGELPLLEWVTMEDDAVRESHAEVNGVVVPVGETFNVDGHDLPYPGAPVGPPEVWINCRCVLRPTIEGDEMSTTTETFEIKEDLEGNDTPAQEMPEPPAMEDGIGDPVPFHAVLAPLGVLSGDRRMLSEEEGAITWRTGPSPVAMRWVKSDVGAHAGAVRVANFDRIWAEDGLIKADGFMFDTPEAQEVISMMARGPIGISVDLDLMEGELVNEDGSTFEWDMEDMSQPEPIFRVTSGRIAGATMVDIPAFQEAYAAMGPWDEAPAGEEEVIEEPVVEESIAAGAFAPGTKDGPGWITNPEDSQRLRDYWVNGEGAAKIRWGTDGDFTRCERELRDHITNPRWLAGTCANLHKEATGTWPGERGKNSLTEGVTMSTSFTLTEAEPDVLVAAAVPSAFFENPNLSGPTPLTIDDDGRIYGHVATWDTCHIANPQGTGICTTAPSSVTDYAYFKTGLVRTTEGDIPVGHITLGTGHAGDRLNAARAAAHYDNTGAVVADVAAGEDAHGIWFSGRVRDVDSETLETLRAAALSGDWRKIRGNLEMVAALAVNVPGFPIPRLSLAASADEGQYSLVASGIVTRKGQEKQATPDVVEFAHAVLDEMSRRQRLAAVREKFAADNKARTERVRQALRK